LINAMESDLPHRLVLLEPVTPIVPVAEKARGWHDLAEGQRFRAVVEARLANGNYRVLVDGHPLQMNLPEGAAAGDTVELVLIARDPRLRFLLLDASTQRMGAPASLSPAARLLGGLAQGSITAPTLPPTPGLAPLLAGPPSESEHLPGLLRQAVSQSGLFYEFHQAQWLSGKRTLEQLLQEPQGRIPAAALLQPDAIDQTSRPGSNPQAEGATAGAPRGMDAPVQERAVALVQQQLGILESGQLSWRGEVWPGQWMEWDICEHAAAETEPAESGRWHTRLRVTLPRLGEVVALVNLDARRVHVALRAAGDESVRLLRAHQEPLLATLHAVGAGAPFLDIHHDGG
jgi:hypothetical protein